MGKKECEKCSNFVTHGPLATLEQDPDKIQCPNYEGYFCSKCRHEEIID